MSFFSKLNKVVDKTNRAFNPEQKNPNPDKNPFQNYYDHLKMLNINWEKDFGKLVQFVESNQYEKALKVIEAMFWQRLTMLNALHDGYDYADELGAAVFSFSLLSVSLISSMKFIYNGLHANLSQNESSYKEARREFFFAAAFLLLGMENLINSTISLVTRPVATVLNGGFKEREKPGFFDESVLLNSPEKAEEFGRSIIRIFS